jgi:hypothetical protein
MSSLESVQKLTFENQRIPQLSIQPRSRRHPATFIAGLRYRGQCAESFSESAVFLGTVRHQLAPFTQVCQYCKAVHWAEEAVKGKKESITDDKPTSLMLPIIEPDHIRVSQSSHLHFSHCCQQGQIILPQFDAPPSVLWHLLVDSTAGTVAFSNAPSRVSQISDSS